MPAQSDYWQSLRIQHLSYIKLVSTAQILHNIYENEAIFLVRHQEFIHLVFPTLKAR
jgi:hypothetical protein